MEHIEEKRLEFGKKLKSIIEEKGMSINQLSKLVGISRSNFNKYFEGETSPKIDTFLSICEALEVSPSDFFVKDKKQDLNSKLVRERKILESIFTLLEERFFYNFDYNVKGEYTLDLHNKSSIYNEAIKEYFLLHNSRFYEEDNLREKIIEKMLSIIKYRLY